MKSKIFTALVALLPFTSVSSFVDDEGDVLDQFMVSAGTTGYILAKAIDCAQEQGFRYVKILKAEYSFGNQSGEFSCLKETDEDGQIVQFEDEAVLLTLSLLNEKPQDTDYMDTFKYQDIADLIGEGFEDYDNENETDDYEE